jgi:hypothetical protein
LTNGTSLAKAEASPRKMKSEANVNKNFKRGVDSPESWAGAVRHNDCFLGKQSGASGKVSRPFAAEKISFAKGFSFCGQAKKIKEFN